MVQRSFSARLDQHPWRMEQEKEQIQTPFPAVGIPRVTSPLHLIPLLLLEQQFLHAPLKTAASSPVNSVMQTPTTTWFCSQLNTP